MKKLLASIVLTILASPTLAGERVRTTCVPREACHELGSQKFSTNRSQGAIQVHQIIRLNTKSRGAGFVTEWRPSSGSGQTGTLVRTVHRKPYTAIGSVDIR